MSRAKVRYRYHLADVVSYLDPGRKSGTSCGLVLGVGSQYLIGKLMCYDRDVFRGVVLGFQCKRWYCLGAEYWSSGYRDVGDSLLEPRGPVGIDVLVGDISIFKAEVGLVKSLYEVFPTGGQEYIG